VTAYICLTCATQYAPSPAPPERCAICEDERQYVPESGQRWTSADELRATHHNEIREDGGFDGVGVDPSLAIGQRALLVPFEGGTLMWDCVPFLDDDAAAEIERRGGLAGIAISHPHYYSGMVEWAERFECPVHLHADDAEWIMRPSPAISLWSGETLSLDGGLTLIRCGGHFAGGTVLHVAAPAGAALGRHRPGDPGPPVRELHVQLPEPHPAARGLDPGDRRRVGAVRVRHDPRSLVGNAGAVRRVGGGREVGGAIRARAARVRFARQNALVRASGYTSPAPRRRS
jgi:hypothetical protein